MNEVFRLAENTRIHTRNSYLKLNHPFQKTSNGENDLSYIGVEEVLKKRENLNVFKLEMNTTIWIIFLNQIYEVFEDLIMLWHL